MRRNFLLLGASLAGLALNWQVAHANSATWDVDFNQYYSAGRLVGGGHLYDWDSIRPLELEHNAKAVPFGRIPAFAVAFKPLSVLPYAVARTLWFCIGLAALAGFVCLWPGLKREWALVAFCWSAPVAMCLALGQDSVLFLFFVALGFRLLAGRQDFPAGLAFSVCIAKPHLALLLPVVLIARLRWKAILGGAVGGAISMSVSFAAEGKDWLQRLLTLARMPDFDPAGGRMPNLRGLLSLVGGGLAVELALGLVVAAAVWFVSRLQPVAVVGAITLAGGLLVSHHAYFYDALLLLPALLLAFQMPGVEWLRAWAFFLFTPVPYLMLLTKLGVVGHLAITGYTLALLAVAASVRLTPDSVAPVPQMT
jgi:hypothetical protein